MTRGRAFAISVAGLLLAATVSLAVLLADAESDEADPRVVVRSTRLAGSGRADAPFAGLHAASAPAEREPLLSSAGCRRIAGRMVRLCDGSPYTEPATIRFGRLTARITAQSVGHGTDDEGRFDISSVPASADYLVVSASRRARPPPFPSDAGNHGRFVQSVRLPPGPDDVLDLEIRLRPGVKITGIVVDPDGRPVAGAGVAIGDSFETLTDRRGEFTLQDVRQAPDRIVLTATVRHAAFPALTKRLGQDPPGEVPLCRLVTLGPLRLQLEAGAVIEGRVTDERGVPLGGVTISVAGNRNDPLSGPLLPDAVTTGDGCYDLQAVQPDLDHVIVARRPGWPVVQIIDVAAITDQTQHLDIVMPWGGLVYGSVVDEHGVGVPGVDLALVARSRKDHEVMTCSRSYQAFPALRVGTVVSGAGGSYALEGVGPEPLQLAAASPPDGFVPMESAIFDGPARGGRVRQDLRLRTAHTLRGTVVDLRGRPLEGAVVGLYVARGNLLPGKRLMTTSDGAGRFALAGVVDGVQRVDVECAGYGSRDIGHPVGFDLEPIALRRVETFGVRVTDATTGLPVHAFNLTTTGDRHYGSWRVHSLDGHFECPILGEGTRTLRLAAPGYSPARLEEVEPSRGRPDQPVQLELEPLERVYRHELPKPAACPPTNPGGPPGLPSAPRR